MRNGARSATLYIDEAFEVEGGAPVKYAFLDGRRLARITGVLDPARERVERLVLAAGWNLVASAVENTASLRDVFGADAAFYEAQGASYTPVSGSEQVPIAQALWVHVPSARLAVLRGAVPEASDRTSPGPLHAWPRLEPLKPADHVEGGALHVYQALDRRWLWRDSTVPAFLNDAPAELGAERAFWSAGPVTLPPTATQNTALVTYHQDHLGTPAALADATGALLEERAHYPYGLERHVHRPQDPPAGADGAGGPWSFTGKERDNESGLVDMGARAYFDLPGIFLSPDPRYVEAAALGLGGERDQSSFTAFLHNPQMGNLYVHAARNPLKYVDPSGLEIVFSPVLQKSPVFQEALALFKKTPEGQRLLARIENSKFKVSLSAGKALAPNDKTGRLEENLGVTQGYVGTGNANIEINVMRHKKDFPDHKTMILQLADTIHHELRHAEGGINQLDLAGMRRGLDWIRKNALTTPNRTGPPANPTLWLESEIDTALDVRGNEPLNQAFRKEAEFEQVKDSLREAGLLPKAGGD